MKKSDTVEDLFVAILAESDDDHDDDEYDDECELCDAMVDLYDNWKPTTSEGKSYKSQLGDLIAQSIADDDDDYEDDD